MREMIDGRVFCIHDLLPSLKSGSKSRRGPFIHYLLMRNSDIKMYSLVKIRRHVPIETEKFDHLFRIASIRDGLNIEKLHSCNFLVSEFSSLPILQRSNLADFLIF